MLPPKELNDRCLQCGLAMRPVERYCTRCAADREVELAVRGELDPAISALQRWLAALGGLSLLIALLLFADLWRMDAMSQLGVLVVPGLIEAGCLFLLCAVARVMPLGASLAALGLFLASWAMALLDSLAGALAPGPILLFRVLFLVVLVGAVHAGWRARWLRRRAAEAFPSAVASYRAEDDPA